MFITNEMNGYFLNSSAQATQTFAENTCVWTAGATMGGTSTTLRIGQTYLRGRNANGANSARTGNNTSGNISQWRSVNTYLVHYYSAVRYVYRDNSNNAYWNNDTNRPYAAFGVYSSYTNTPAVLTVADITGIDNTVTTTGTYNLASAASYTPAYYTFSGGPTNYTTRYYAAGYTTGAVTARPSAKTSGFTSDTWSLNKSIPGLTISNAGVLTYSSYVTEDTQVTITHTVTENGSTKTATKAITLKGKIATTLSFASTSLNMTATTLSLPAVNLTASNGSTPPGTVTYSSNNTGCISVSNTGVLTINGAGTATITANYAANGDYLASSATMTITVANAACLYLFFSIYNVRECCNISTKMSALCLRCVLELKWA